MNPTVFFFGCMKDATPHHTQAGHYMYRNMNRESYETSTPWGRTPDGPLCPPEKEHGQPQGAAVLHQKDGWTAIGFWDRTGDSRGNSNANFMVQGTYTFDEMCAMAQEAYPQLWKRFGKVYLHSENIPHKQGFYLKKDGTIELHGHPLNLSSVNNVLGDVAAILKIKVLKEE